MYTKERLYAQGYQSNHDCTSSMLYYVTLSALGGRCFLTGGGVGVGLAPDKSATHACKSNLYHGW